jgi:PBP1b-binding outer membrane lipoprotein LpoB
MTMCHFIQILFLSLLFSGCSSSEERTYQEVRKQNRTYAPIERYSEETKWEFEDVEVVKIAPYPWEEKTK